MIYDINEITIANSDWFVVEWHTIIQLYIKNTSEITLAQKNKKKQFVFLLLPCQVAE